MLLKAYRILSDKDSRFLYDNYGTVSDSRSQLSSHFVTLNNFLLLLIHLIELILALGGKASLNHHVGGDSWKPYIGNLEIGIWMFSFINDESMPELEHVTSAEQKERRHIIRVSNIARYLPARES